MAGTLYVVATPIGNLEDITVRALRILKEVALIAAEDTRHTAHLLTRYGIVTPTTSLHEHNERQKSSTLIARLLHGESVALVSDAGTPTVSDPGRLFIADAIAAGIRVEPIPGPNAAIAALSASGLAFEEFVFLGFPPTRSNARKQWMDRLANCGAIAVFHEAPHRILSTLGEIRTQIGDISVVIARELTKTHEELVRGPISRILERGFSIKGEFTVVADIGHTTDYAASEMSIEAKLAALVIEFGHSTTFIGQSKRQAIAGLAKKYGVTTKAAYSAVENAKHSGV